MSFHCTMRLFSPYFRLWSSLECSRDFNPLRRRPLTRAPSTCAAHGWTQVLRPCGCFALWSNSSLLQCSPDPHHLVFFIFETFNPNQLLRMILTARSCKVASKRGRLFRPSRCKVPVILRRKPSSGLPCTGFRVMTGSSFDVAERTSRGCLLHV